MEARNAELTASILNFAESGKILNLLDYFAEYNEIGVFELFFEIMDSGIEPSTLISQIIVMLREFLIAAVTKKGKYMDHAKKWDRLAIIKAIDIFSDAERRMAVSSKQRVLLESALMKVLLPESQEISSDSILRIDKLEKKFERLSSVETTVKHIEVLHNEEKQADTTTKSDSVSVNISNDAVDFWINFSNFLRNEDIALYARIRGISAKNFEGNKLILTSDIKSKLNLLIDEQTKRTLEMYVSKFANTTLFIEINEQKEVISDIMEDVVIID